MVTQKAKASEACSCCCCCCFCCDLLHTWCLDFHYCWPCCAAHTHTHTRTHTRTHARTHTHTHTTQRTQVVKDLERRVRDVTNIPISYGEGAQILK